MPDPIVIEGTPQELFDRAVIAVDRQGKPSRGADGRCLYRGPGGLKCAAGHLIDDDDAAMCFDAKPAAHSGVYDLARHGRLAFESEGARRTVSNLQVSHDFAASDADFRRGFRKRAIRVAAQFGLTMPELPPLEDV